MNNGDKPAFATDRWSEGLTKREYFAAAAMQGLLAGDEHYIPTVAEYAVKFADAVLAELDNPPQGQAGATIWET